MPEWWPFGFFLLLVATTLTYSFVAWRRRKKVLVAFAQEYGLEFCGSQIPADVPFELLISTRSWGRMSNCVSGMRHGERVICFDCTQGFWGRWKRRVTAVAKKRMTQSDELPNYPSVWKLEVYQSENWVLAFKDRGEGRMSPDEILLLWDFQPPLRAPQSSLSDDENVLRPRNYHTHD